MQAILLSVLVTTAYSVQCWEKKADSTGCAANEHQACDNNQGKYETENICCMAFPNVKQDLTGNAFRKCLGGITLKQEFDKYLPQKKELNGATAPQKGYDDKSQCPAVVMKWNRYVLKPPAITGRKAQRESKQKTLETNQDKMSWFLYTDYNGDIIYYDIFEQLFNDPLFHKFQNQIVENNGTKKHFVQYYRAFLPGEPVNLNKVNKEKFTVANMMEISITLWLDLFLGNNDRFAVKYPWGDESANSGNMMMHEDKNNFWRFYPIDNGPGNEYIENNYKTEKREDPLGERWKFIEKLSKNDNYLFNFLKGFVAKNKNTFIPGDLDAEVLAKIAHNTWYSFAPEIGKRLDALLKEKEIFKKMPKFAQYIGHVIDTLLKNVQSKLTPLYPDQLRQTLVKTYKFRDQPFFRGGAHREYIDIMDEFEEYPPTRPIGSHYDLLGMEIGFTIGVLFCVVLMFCCGVIVLFLYGWYFVINWVSKRQNEIDIQ